MIVHDLEPTGRWYFVAVHYPTARMARTVWERADRYRRGRPRTTIGIVRLGDVQSRPGWAPSGVSAGTNPVVALTTDEQVAKRLERLLATGTPWTPTTEVMDALIARLVHNVTRAPTGRYVARRPDRFGAVLDTRGNVYEPPRQG